MGEEQEQKFHQLTEEPVSRVISHLAVPCIISMLVTAFYNMADTFFVGMLRSNAATGAVGVVFSMLAVIQAVGFFFGHVTMGQMLSLPLLIAGLAVLWAKLRPSRSRSA